MPTARQPTADPGGYLDRIRWVEVRNTADTDAPGGGLLRVTGADADGTLTVARPDADSQARLLVAHPAGVPAGGRGLGTYTDLVPATWDPGDGDPAAGEEWGSEADDWRLHSGQTGYRIATAGATTNGVRLAEVQRAGGGGDTSDPNANTFAFWGLLVGESGSESSGYTYTVRRLLPFESDGDPTTTTPTTTLFSTSTFTVSGAREAQHRRCLTIADPGSGVNVPALISGSARPRNDYPIVFVNRVVVEAGATDQAYYQFHLDQPFDDTRVGHVTTEDQVCGGRKTSLDGWYAAAAKSTLGAGYDGTSSSYIAAVERDSTAGARAGVYGDAAGTGGTTAQVGEICQMGGGFAWDAVSIASAFPDLNQFLADAADPQTVASGLGVVGGRLTATAPVYCSTALPVTLGGGGTGSYGVIGFVGPGVVGAGLFNAGELTVGAVLSASGPVGWENAPGAADTIAVGPGLVTVGGMLAYIPHYIDYWSVGPDAPAEPGIDSAYHVISTSLVLADPKQAGGPHRLGVRRGGKVAWGADGESGVLTYFGTTLVSRTTDYYRSGLWVGALVEMASPPPPPPAPPPPAGGGLLVVTVQDKGGAPLAGRTVTTTAGGGTTDANGQVIFTGVTVGAGTSTVTLAAGEGCISSASWPGGSNLSNSNRVPYTVVDAAETGVVHVVFADVVKFDAVTGELAVTVGGVEATAVTNTRTPDRSISALLPGTVHDQALPASAAGRSVYLGVGTGTVTFTGFAASGGNADGMRVRLVCPTGSTDYVINHQDAGSTAANRVITHTGAAVTLAADGWVDLEYDGTASRWRIGR